AAFQECRTRLLFRPTYVYARLLQRTLIPRLLRNGVDRSLELEGVTRHALAMGDYGSRQIVRSELASLEQLDFPYFESATNANAVILQNGRAVDGLLEASSYSAVLEQIRTLSAE